MPHTEKRFKKGEIICRPKEMVMSMYNILYGSVGVYFDYGTPEEVPVVTLHEGDFFNVISFLESRQRNTTAVALEPTIVSEITYDNFSAYFREKPAKIMSLLQHMSGSCKRRMWRHATRWMPTATRKSCTQSTASGWTATTARTTCCGPCSRPCTPTRRRTATR